MDRVPIVSRLDEIYSSSALPEEQKRWDSLLQQFSSRYDARPTFVARAPGRVNIIGDHVDYAQLSCVPAAIQPDVLIAGRAKPATSRSTIHLASTESERFRDEVIEFTSADDLSFASHSWGNYVRAALKGVLGSQSGDLRHFEMQLLVTGNIPPGGGLSSSAAMVIASSIACLQALDQLKTVNRTEMTEIAIVSERAVGVNSGGMDQTASVFGQRSSLLHISFVPKLTSRPVRLPEELAFVIANSLVTSEKALTAKRHYNLRVVEMRAFTAVLARRLGVKDLPSPPTTKMLIDALPSSYGSTEEERVRKLLGDVENQLGSEKSGTSWDSALEQLGLSSRKEFEKEYQQGIEIEADDLKLYKRAKHVLTETLLVYQVCHLLESPPSNKSLPDELGQSFNASQASLRDDFQSSCDAIDELIEIALRSGSLGSRVTGAGWGGCSVHLVRAGDEERLISALREAYYTPRYPKLTEMELKAACFATRPETGACLYDVA